MAGGGLLDPLRQLPFAGLKYLAHIDDGVWDMMLTPGASGYGMIIWSMAHSCSNCGDFIPQWYLPALCQWTSISNKETGLIDQTVSEAYADVTRLGRYPDYEMVLAPWGPMVGITHLDVPEEYECYHYSCTVSNNLATSGEDCDGMACKGDITAFGPVIGLAPVMAVVPIEYPEYVRWRAMLGKAWKGYADVFANFSHCMCDREYWDDDDNEECGCLVHALIREHGTTEVWNNKQLSSMMWDAEANCECPYHAFDKRFAAMVSALPTFVDEMDEEFGQVWDYAIGSFFAGWRWLEEHTPKNSEQTTERNAWLTFFSRRFSPFWGPGGLREYLQTHGLEQSAA